MSMIGTPRLRYYQLIKMAGYCIFFVFLFGHFIGPRFGTPINKQGNDFAPDKPVPIILLKLPRSGSTWLTDRLNSERGCFISKEIVQSNHKGYPIKTIENHLKRALSFPMDKVSTTKRKWFHLPTARYLEDYVYPGKFIKSLDYVGFSLNLEHVTGINWQNVYDPRNRPIALILFRLNIIKSAISGFYGKKLKKLCGSNNIRQGSLIMKGTSSDCSDHVMTSKVDWSIVDFVNEINFWLVRTQNYTRMLRSSELIASLPTIVVTYEDLKYNMNIRLSTILTLSKELHSARSQSKMVLSNYSNAGLDSVIENDRDKTRLSTWLPRSKSDSLRDILLNYDIIYKALSDNSCHCVKNMLSTMQYTGNGYDILGLPIVCSGQLHFGSDGNITCF